MTYDMRALKAHLGKERAKNVLFFDCLPSTNTYLKSLASTAQSGTVVIADGQTNGKGRYGKSFHSPCGKGIYLSYLIKNVPSRLMHVLTPMCAVAVKHAIQSTCQNTVGDKIKIKWVNDLFMGEKKLCGILCEAVFINGAPCAVVGVGLNVLQSFGDFPCEIADTACSLYTQTGVKISRTQLSADIIKALDELSEENVLDFFKEYAESCITLGKSCRIISPCETKNAFISGINEDFSLNAVYEDGTSGVIRSGEIQVKW